MSQDATSDASEGTTASATEDEGTTQTEQTAGNAVQNEQQSDGKGEQPAKSKSGTDEDKLGDGGKRALQEERKARRDAEKNLTALQARLQEFEDRDKTELQRAIERAEAAEKGASSMRVANTRLMAAVTHNIPPELMDLLGDGTDEEIDARAKLLADKLATAAPPPESAPEPERRAPVSTRPVESLTAGGQPAGQKALDMDAILRQMSGRT